MKKQKDKKTGYEKTIDGGKTWKPIMESERVKISERPFAFIGTKVREVAPKKKTRNNRTAGHTYERDCAIELRELGFKHIVCTRGESGSRDAEKIDLMNKNEIVNGRFPYNIQCKNSAHTPKYLDILVGTKTTEPMPKVPGVVNVIFHKLTVKGGETGKFMCKGEFAILEKEQFLAMVKELEHLRTIAKNGFINNVTCPSVPIKTEI